MFRDPGSAVLQLATVYHFPLCHVAHPPPRSPFCLSTLPQQRLHAACHLYALCWLRCRRVCHLDWRLRWSVYNRSAVYRRRCCSSQGGRMPHWQTRASHWAAPHSPARARLAALRAGPPAAATRAALPTAVTGQSIRHHRRRHRPHRRERRLMAGGSIAAVRRGHAPDSPVAV